MGGVVWIGPPDVESPGVGWANLGVVTEWSAMQEPFSTRHIIRSVKAEPYRFVSIQEQADRLAAEQLARDLPGAAGW